MEEDKKRNRETLEMERVCAFHVFSVVKMFEIKVMHIEK